MTENKHRTLTRTATIPLLLLLGVVLTGCSGGAMQASSWPGMTISGDRIYVANGPAVHALDLQSGRQLWRFPAQAERGLTMFATPAISEDGILVFGAYDNQIYAIDTETGSTTWSQPYDQPEDRIVAGSLIVEDLVFTPTAGGRLFALDIQTGHPAWPEPFQPEEVSDPLWSTPLLVEERVYLASLDHHVYALDLSGRLIWESDELSSAILDTPSIADGRILVGTFGKELIALNLTNGSVAWRIETDGRVWGNPALANGSAFFGDTSGSVYALSIEDGREQWRETLPGGVIATPAIGANAVYFVTDSGTLHALDPQDGRDIWGREVSVAGRLMTDPVLYDGTLFVAAMSEECLIFDVDVESGALRCFFQPAE
jgi:outer membrane protein assembly factor BamB